MNTFTQQPAYELDHFLEAQNEVWSQVIFELHNGQKASHWMWFIFPQLLGLGKSQMSIKYAIKSLDHARAYWHHPILGARLRE